MWFAQLEGQFALSNSTQDSRKFCYVISQLDNKNAAEVVDVKTHPHTHRPLRPKKAELI